MPFVYASAGGITQVLFNLMQNALNHTQEGNITLLAKAESGKVSVCVSDTGCGIPVDLLPHIFEHGVSGSEGGSGIGLAICKEIIDSHGGEICIKSDLGKGTRAWFTLTEMPEGGYDGAPDNPAGGRQ